MCLILTVSLPETHGIHGKFLQGTPPSDRPFLSCNKDAGYDRRHGISKRWSLASMAVVMTDTQAPLSQLPTINLSFLETQSLNIPAPRTVGLA